MKDYVTHHRELKGAMKQLTLAIPDTMRSFGQLHRSSLDDGALSKKTKELLALAIAITVRCDGCIAFHVHDAVSAGAGREEIAEAIGVAVLMGGGPAVMYGCEALEALDQFTKAPS